MTGAGAEEFFRPVLANARHKVKDTGDIRAGADADEHEPELAHRGAGQDL